MKILKLKSDIRKAISEEKGNGKKIGFVPTMGALHEGHLSLVELAKKKCDVIVVSIFVNPTQFGPNEDFASYPRTMESDIEKLNSLNVDFLFAPNTEGFYSAPHFTHVENQELGSKYCGAFRENHFQGVLTVVTKLFNVVNPDHAFFGEKDFQQAFMIKKMVEDLDMDLTVETGSTIREENGLAKSSRNVKLSVGQFRTASHIFQSMQLAKKLVSEGQTNVSDLREKLQEYLKNHGIEQIQYIEFVSRKTLLSLDLVGPETQLLIACYMGNVRLIDNFRVM